LIDGFLKLMDQGDNINTPINLGNPQPITMITLAETIMELIGKKLDIEYLPLPQDDPRKRRPDISKAKQQLLWEPTVTLKDGLNETISYFKKII